MRSLGATLVVVSLLGVAGSAEAQGAAELFGKVASTVVVVRAKDAGQTGKVGSATSAPASWSRATGRS